MRNVVGKLDWIDRSIGGLCHTADFPSNCASRTCGAQHKDSDSGFVSLHPLGGMAGLVACTARRELTARSARCRWERRSTRRRPRRRVLFDKLRNEPTSWCSSKAERPATFIENEPKLRAFVARSQVLAGPGVAVRIDSEVVRKNACDLMKRTQTGGGGK